MKLSVRLQTYNHAAFIEECLRSIDEQNTDFDFEVVIGDDFSTDDTSERIRAFIEEQAGNSRVNYRLLERGEAYVTKREKLGRLVNFTDILDHCKGEYIALLDGDDYWKDRNKLQRQVDFLERRKDVALCFHQTTKIFDDSERTEKFNEMRQQQEFELKDIVASNFISTCSVVYRSGTQKYPDLIYDSPIGDWILYIHVAQGGKIVYLPDDMGVYRIHGGGLWQSKRNWSFERQIASTHRMLKLNSILSEWLKGQGFSKILRRRRAKLQLDLLVFQIKSEGWQMETFKKLVSFFRASPSLYLLWRFTLRVPYAVYYSMFKRKR